MSVADNDDHRTGVGLEHWDRQFPETHWSILIIDREKTVPASAVERQFTDLCSRYWYPLYAFLRQRGRSSHDAQDLTQGFFAYLLSGDRMINLNPEKGRFRSYLLAAMEHYLNDQRKYGNAQKRGGGIVPISIEEELAENRFQNEPSDDLTAEKLFDRKWATTVLEEAKSRLSREFGAQGKGRVFEAVGEYLVATPPPGEYANLAAKLGLNEDNVRAIVSRMRKRYKTLVRDQVRVTVSTEEEIDGEIRYLLDSFA